MASKVVRSTKNQLSILRKRVYDTLVFLNLLVKRLEDLYKPIHGLGSTDGIKDYLISCGLSYFQFKDIYTKLELLLKRIDNHIKILFDKENPSTEPDKPFWELSDKFFDTLFGYVDKVKFNLNTDWISINGRYLFRVDKDQVYDRQNFNYNVWRSLIVDTYLPIIDQLYDIIHKFLFPMSQERNLKKANLLTKVDFDTVRLVMSLIDS